MKCMCSFSAVTLAIPVEGSIMSMLQTFEMPVSLNSRRWQQNILKFKKIFFFFYVHFILPSFTLPLKYMAFFERLIHLDQFFSLAYTV